MVLLLLQIWRRRRNNLHPSVRTLFHVWIVSRWILTVIPVTGCRRLLRSRLHINLLQRLLDYRRRIGIVWIRIVRMRYFPQTKTQQSYAQGRPPTPTTSTPSMSITRHTAGHEQCNSENKYSHKLFHFAPPFVL
jgi:hypothetical protein